MIQPAKIFLLLTSLLIASCDCNNSDVDNGPRGEKEEPRLTLTLREGVKIEELYVNEPIQVVLKEENFEGHDITAYKFYNQKAEKGDFHLLDFQGKAEKKLEDGEEVKFKDSELPLIFVPNGKGGKETISLNLTSSKNGKSFEVSLELDLKEVEPKLGLKLAQGVKEKDVCVNRPIPLVLKDESFSKNSNNKYRIGDSLEYEKGNLHLMDSKGKADKKLRWGDNIELQDGELPLMFVPNGKIGKETVRLLLKTENGKAFDVSLELDLYMYDWIMLHDSQELREKNLASFNFQSKGHLLSALDLRGAKELKESSWMALHNHCPNLVYLNISGWPLERLGCFKPSGLLGRLELYQGLCCK